MAKSCIVFLAIFLLSSYAAGHGHSSDESSSSVKWATRHESTTGACHETITNLQFYFHDNVTGENVTAVRVAQAAGTDQSPTLFGAVLVADDPLTETADPGSKLIGRAQGIYALASRNDVGLLMDFGYTFLDGPYNGSSISIAGRNPVLQTNRELPILGGTGIFRMARGYAMLKTISATSSGNVVVHYNVTVHTPTAFK